MQKAKTSLISIVIPCYNEELNVNLCYKSLNSILSTLKQFKFEYIFVDNGSSDRTRYEISFLAKKNEKVKGVFLARNFGPESSIQAGMNFAKGDAVIIYECDMQDPPEVILAFTKKWQEGFDIVIGIRTKIEDDPLMTIVRINFYRIMKKVANIDVPVNAGTFGLMSRRVVDAINSLPEKYRFFRGLRAWVGFKSYAIPYKRKRRQFGKSSYTFFDYLRHAERSFFGFSYLQLDIMVYLGFFLVAASFIFIVGYLLVSVLTQSPIQSIITLGVLIIFFGGIQLLALSIIGKYIQVIVEETKSRPMYIVEETKNI